MKPTIPFSLVVLAAFAFGGIPGSAARMPPNRRNRRCSKDFSPVGGGKAGLVTSYADVVEPVEKAVVTITLSKTVRVPVNPLLRQFFGNIPDQQYKEEGLGSGVIVSPDGYILTNNHVVEGADELKVMLSDGREFPAKVIGTDEKTDVAVVKIEATNLASVTLADSDKLRVGDIVFAVGNPLNVGETVTMGIVSAKGRNQLGLLDQEQDSYENYIQTDAAINMGNSGGALVDAKGRLVGINSAILAPGRGNGNVGIGFAIPVNLAASVMQSLIATGTVSRGYLGVNTGQTMTADIADQLGLAKDTKGVIILDVTAGSPAEKAGLKQDDVVLAVNDSPVSSIEELRLEISEFPPGSQIVLKIMRDNKPVALSVTLATLAEKPNELLTGVTVAPLTDEARRRLGITVRVNGLLVTAVDEGSPYADQLAPDMVIMEINRTPVTDLAAAKAQLKPGHRNLLFFFYRGGPGFKVITLK